MSYFCKGPFFLFDPLSLFFLGVIALVSVPSLVFSFGYLKHFSLSRRVLATFLAVVFIFSMAAVVTAANLLFFLFVWEVMSLVSYFLVVFEHEHEPSVTAGTIYLVMTHVGTAFLLAAFLIMHRYAGSFDLAAVRGAAAAFPASLKNLLFVFLFIGFGFKAGLVPFHIWLPYAHPQAPSHISSIMSGVMIKVAVYGMLRFIVTVLGAGQAWWGGLVLVLAGVSCLVGVIYALMENDIKKLLAYSSVENIGIILMAVGAGMIFWHAGLSALASVAFAAGLYHVINHAVFKGTFFLCAGSVYHATGTRDIEKMGGLIKRMPQTAAAFLIASMSISALPPLSGFVSEWLIFQALFSGAQGAVLGQKLFLACAMGCLALTSGLAAACFVKAFGVTFLGMPRSRRAQDAQEVPLSMKASVLFLSVVTVGLGLCAGPVWKKLLGLTSGFLNDPSVAAVSSNAGPGAILLPSNGVTLNTPLVALLLLLGVAAIRLFVVSFGRRMKRVAGPTWGCGYYQLDARTEYSSTAFSKPFRIAFSFFLRPTRRSEKIRESFYHVKHFTYETRTTSVFKRYFYQPLLNGTFDLAQRMKVFQMGSIHWYLAYIFVTLVVLVVFFAGVWK